MKEKCQKIMEKFYAADKNQLLSPSVSFHLFCCEECRARVRLLTKAEKLAAIELSQKVDVDSEEVTKIVKNAMEKQKDFIKVSFRSWGISGFFVLVFCIFLSLLSNDAAPMVQFSGSIFSGLCISFYIMTFIGANLDIFVKKTGKFNGANLISM